MAGDASLGITPVMKWNFERSCYRWLVTRHPAQFERLDFTAQILQSASRARKAFYECGWAEAKVLIRPSDGKFERTPFFDAIIRRGLRNSTRFDASTLTEDEIEALGMHRDETLGFKLQIRHFRSNRKELPPQGRGGGGVRKQQHQRQQQQQPSPPPQGHRLPGAAMVGARSLPLSHSGGVGARAAVGSGVEQQQQQQQQPQWGTEAAAVAAAAAAAAAASRSSGDPRWADEARWHRSSVHGGGGGGGERWTAWDANRWMPGSEGASPTINDRDHRYTSNTNGHLSGTPLGRGLTHASSPSAVPQGIAAPARHGAWDGPPPPGGVWGGQERRLGSSSWHLSAGGVEGRGETFERSLRSEGEGVAREGFNGGGGARPQQQQQAEAEVDVRASGGAGGSFRFHPSVVVEQQQGQHPGPGNRTSPGPVGGPSSGGGGFRHGAVGIDAPARDESPDSSSAGAAGSSLISQGYRRLAAMADERAAAAAVAGGGGGGGGLNGRRIGGAPTAAAVLDYHARHESPGRQPLPHPYDGGGVPAPAAVDHKRTAASMTGSCNGSGSGSVDGMAGPNNNNNGSNGNGSGGGPPVRSGETAGFKHGGQFSQHRPQLLSAAAAGEDGSPVKKKPRPSVDGGERPVVVNGGGSAHQADGPIVLRRSSSDEKPVQSAWQRDVRGLSTPPPLSGAQGELLARELAESERHLLSSRVALDLAQARYEEASRAHHAKRDQVIAAAAAEQNQRAIAEAASTSASQLQQQQQQRQRHQRQTPQQKQQQQQQGTLEECSSLHSLARSCEAAAASSETEASPSANNGDASGAGDGGSGGSGGSSGGSSGSEDDRGGGGGGGGGAVARPRYRHRRRDSASPIHGRSYAPLNRGGGGGGGGGRSSEAGDRSLSVSSSSPEMTVPSPRRKLPSGSSKAALGPECADEMREVKLEAALLCGIGRAPVARRSTVSSSSSSASPGSTPTAAAPASDPAASGSGAAAARHPNPPPSNAAAAAIAQVPGSPSASGDTDSDHSSLGGGGSGGREDGAGGSSSKQRQQQQRQQQQQQRPTLMGGSRETAFDDLPRSGSAEKGAATWGGYGRGGSAGMGGGGGGERRLAAPHAKLAGDVLV